MKLAREPPAARVGERRGVAVGLVLTGAHRSVHNRLHQQGVGHDHTPATDHAEHH